MQNIIVCAYGSGVGGMEVFFSEYIKYLLRRNFNVYLLTINDSKNIYFELLDGISGISYIYRDPDNIMYMTNKQRNIQRSDIRKQIQNIDFENTYGICGYFRDLLILIDVFKGTNSKILLVWPHPLDWVNYIPFKQKQYFLKKNKNSLYYYQKRLLRELDDSSGSYYTSYAIFDFNNWYYEEEMPERVIEGLPIQKNSGDIFNYTHNINANKWNILWVGRFDFYKNDAIFRIFKTLEDLADRRNLKISFNIVGHGAPEYVSDLKRRIVPHNIEVNYLGAVQPSELNIVFSKNDLGIGMGVTVKQMGYAGLPAILIDSLSDEYKGSNICSWVFDIDIGDDGDGLYYQIIGKPLSNRRAIEELLEDVFENPDSLDVYSRKCQNYIKKNYSYERQYEIITNRVLTSNFSSGNIEVYRYGFLRRCIRKIVKLIRNVR